MKDQNNTNLSSVYTSICDDDLIALRDRLNVAFAPLLKVQLSNAVFDDLRNTVNEALAPILELQSTKADFKELHASIDAAFSSVIKAQVANTALKGLDDIACQLSSIVTRSIPKNFGVEILKNTLDHFSKYLEPHGLTSIADNLSVSNGYVLIADDAAENLSNLLTNPREETAPNITHQMTIRDFFLSIVIPLLCMVVPMIQNTYYRRLDSLESGKTSLQEVEYHEALLDLETQRVQELEELNSNLHQLLLYLESDETGDLFDPDCESLLPTSQESSLDSLAVEHDIVDVPDNLDTHQP